MNRKDRRAAGNAATRPNRNFEAGYLLALARDHHQAGGLEEAATLYARAIKLDPESADAHHGLGHLLMERDELDEAAARLRRALALRPGDPAAEMCLMLLLKQQGRRAEAAAAFQRAIAADPRSGELRRQLLDELASPWVRPIELARAGIAFIKLNPAVAAAAERAVKAWPVSPDHLFGPSGIGPVAADTVLRGLLEACPICDIALERFLTALRGAILGMAGSAVANDDLLALGCALAGQCFLNDYIWSAGDAEIREAERLRDRLIDAIGIGGPTPPLWLPAVASYFPLHGLPGADALPAMSWPEPVAALLTRQIAEPREEQRLRETMPVLSAVADATSQLVRAQYEENPYPRWVKPSPAGPATTLDADMRSRFPLASYRGNGKGGDIDILIAGCGTGQQSIEAARRFAGARIVAVDLSLASLGYAKRQSRACGLDAIHYAQADIMELPATGQHFDLIESGGVLHHLADPMEGWRRLLAILRPGGVMRLGFYSEAARQDIAAARRHIAAQGYGGDIDGIRRCRQDLMARADGTTLKAVTAWPDFFSSSECRDLLFHVMEHRLTLPAIKAFLAANDLEFLSFELDNLTLRRYRHRHPGDAAMIDLDSWHRFEQRHPATFAAMYQFWVQKPG